MQEDPAGVAGGTNLYMYSAGSPLEASDPTGLVPSGDAAFLRSLALPYGPNPSATYQTLAQPPGDWNFGLTYDDGFGFYSLTTGANGWGTKWALAQQLKRTWEEYVGAYAISKELYNTEPSAAGTLYDGSEALGQGEYNRIVGILSNTLSHMGSDGLNYSLWISQRLNLGYIFINDASPPGRAGTTFPGSEFTAFTTEAFKQSDDILMNDLVHEEIHTGIIRGECPAFAGAYRITGVWSPLTPSSCGIRR
jgi:hypothetical protein